MIKLKKFVMFLGILLILLVNDVLGLKLASFPDLLKPSSLTVDGNQIFIADQHKVYIYSLEDFSLQKKFGKEGEGPQEFLGRAFIYVKPDHIIVNSETKISYFTRDGIYQREIRVPHGFWFNSIGEKYVGYCIVSGENGETYSAVNIFDSNFKKIKEINRYKFWFQEERPINPLNLITPKFCIHDEKIITRGKNGTIEIHDSTGKKLLSITQISEKIKLTNNHKKGYHYYFSKVSQYKVLYEAIKNFITFPTYFPEVRSFKLADNKIYILTFKRIEKKSEFCVFSMEGKFLKRLMIPFADKNIVEFFPYTIHKGKLYQLIESENDEEWGLYKEEID